MGLGCVLATMRALERKRAAGHVKETVLYARFSVKFQTLRAELKLSFRASIKGL
jgi:hypothetical protein